MRGEAETSGAASSVEQAGDALLRLLRQLGGELKIRPARLQALHLDSRFDKDLGLDSLTRMELLTRVEAHFAVHLAEQVYANVETPRDLLRAVLAAHASNRQVSVPDVDRLRLAQVHSAPIAARTLLDVLDWHCAQHPDRPHIRFYQDDGAGETVSYGRLRQRAEAVAVGLQRLGLAPRAAVAIMLPTGAEYFYAFWGALLAGGVPVPIYPPARPSQLEDHLLRHSAILANCQAAVLITEPEALPVARLLKSHVPELQAIADVAELSAAPGVWSRPSVTGGDIAFLQYTSGSTGTPKGVMLSHANLLANVRAMGEATAAGSGDVFVSWLPLYHDMGLIGAWLGSLYHAMLLVNFSPLAFLARPSRWLWAIHRHGGTLTAAPNFAYELCLKRLKGEALQGLNLASLRLMFNGAEPVDVDTLERFSDYFSRFGLDPKAMTPVYGLAENSVGLTFPPLQRGPLLDCVERDTLARSGRAVPCDRDAAGIRFPSCGRVIPGHEIRIVDSAGRELPEREQGLLEFRGPSATAGYYRNPGVSRELFHDGWVKSGDLAYMVAGEVYLTGRVKDIIIHAGRNLYPHELENAIGKLPGVRDGCVAVFGCADAHSGTEKLVVMAESRESGGADGEALRTRIDETALALIGMPPDEIVLAPPHTVLKTSSGKIRRSACRELYESGLALSGPRSAKAQMFRLLLAAGWPQLRRRLRDLGALLYAGYAWAVLAPLAVLGWLGIVLCPVAGWRWPILRGAARLIAWLTATPVALIGRERLPAADRPCLFVCNHASYLDGLFLAHTLPQPLAFVAKAELARHGLVGPFLRRIGAEFVERFDRRQGLDDAQRLTELARRGRFLLYFPEGTFTRSSGLLPFRMGAFQAAARGDLPIVPLAIRGTRDILRDGSWLPRRGAVSVIVGQTIDTAALREREHLPDDWAVSVRLRDLAREQILQYGGEPDSALDAAGCFAGTEAPD